MRNKNFLEEKFIEINKLKSMVITYPEEYKNNIIQVLDKVCNEITRYINENKSDTNREALEVSRKFTLEELAQYNGMDGMPAYVAINGTVYDTNDTEVWKNGTHFGIQAGLDHTENFKNAHKNSMDVLKKLRVIGTIKQ